MLSSTGQQNYREDKSFRLIQLLHTESTPTDSEVTCQCAGTVVLEEGSEPDNKKYFIVAYPYFKCFSNSKGIPNRHRYTEEGSLLTIEVTVTRNLKRRFKVSIGKRPPPASGWTEF